MSAPFAAGKHNLAFTIGNRKGYDHALATQERAHKTGVRPESDPPYRGGWVWKTAEDADAFIKRTPLPFVAAVYAIELPTGWNEDVSPEPCPEDGVHNLLHDAVILHRVDLWPTTSHQR